LCPRGYSNRTIAAQALAATAWFGGVFVFQKISPQKQNAQKSPKILRLTGFYLILTFFKQGAACQMAISHKPLQASTREKSAFTALTHQSGY
jgi:hypothetical protein